MKNLEVYLTSISIEGRQTKHKQNHLKKLRNKQSNKLNKNILIAKTLEAFTPKAKYGPYIKNDPYEFLSLKLAQYYVCKT